jgi:hypothetical protein
MVVADKRVEQNRIRFREQWVPKIYSGKVHATYILLATSGIAAFCLSKISNWTAAVFVAAGCSILFANISSYLSHRYPQHHPMRFQKFLFWFHTQEHHSLFNQEFMERDSWDDAYMVLFPPSVVSMLVLVLFPVEGIIVGRLFGADIGYVFCGTLSLYYLAYEFVHFASHSPKNLVFYKVPGIRFLANHHRVHHNPRYMTHWNFDIVFPFFDFLFRTLKKE